MINRKIILLSTLLILLSGCDNSPIVAGVMTNDSICNTAGFLIRKELGQNVKTAGLQCKASSDDGVNVLIKSHYRTPINSQVLKYTAKGFVKGDTLTLKAIKVHGIDDNFQPFTSLGG